MINNWLWSSNDLYAWPSSFMMKCPYLPGVSNAFPRSCHSTTLTFVPLFWIPLLYCTLLLYSTVLYCTILLYGRCTCNVKCYRAMQCLKICINFLFGNFSFLAFTNDQKLNLFGQWKKNKWIVLQYDTTSKLLK